MTENTGKHTPGKWSMDRQISWLNEGGEAVEHHGRYTVELEDDCIVIAYLNEELPNYRDNAAFIVKAVNNHTRLRNALKDLLDQVESLEDHRLTRDLDPDDAEACWEDAISEAKKLLKETQP